LTDKLELVIIELPKIKEDETSELMDWLMFLQNPNFERVKEKMGTNKELREAKEKLQGISEGKAIGKKEKQKEIAKKMLELKMPIEQIKEITDLSKEEINQLLN